jgi:hypothetical protein
MSAVMCSRCGIRAARAKEYNWRPELCGPCAEAVKHPSQRGCTWTPKGEP